MDFDLEPGASDSWVTAFISLVLVRVAPCLDVVQGRAVGMAVEHALAFLLRSARVNNEGLPFWGYNGRVPADADTTAHVALLLHATAHPAAAAAARALLAFVSEDGGVSTFQRRSTTDRWGHSHPDVTAVALRALAQELPPGTRTVVNNGVAYLKNARQLDGMWPSFWWTTPLFATAAALRLFRDLEVTLDMAPIRASLDAMEPATAAFDNALLLAIIRLVAGDRERESMLIDALWRAQLQDGSWPSVARLRVPDPGHEDGACLSIARPLCVDQHRLYTTATVLHVLARQKSCDSASP